MVGIMRVRGLGWSPAIFLLGATVLGACGGPEEPAIPCGEPHDPLLELAGTNGGFGELMDGGEVIVGDGIQSGGSFVSLKLRAKGLDPESPAFHVEMWATTPEGVELAHTPYDRQLLCSNAGPSEGYLVSPGLHVRLPNGAAEDFVGIEAIFRVEVTDHEDATATAQVRATMVLEK